LANSPTTRGERLAHALAQASRLRREPVLRFWVDGYSAKEIAAALGLDKKVVWSIVRYARNVGDPRAAAGDHMIRVESRLRREERARTQTERLTSHWGSLADAAAEAARLRRESVLRFWASGQTGGQIAAATGIPRNSVLRIVRTARLRGDPRAASRPVPQALLRQGKYA